MNLIVIRHGQSEADILGVHEGRADFELTELGKVQAGMMAQWVAAKYPIGKILSSPLKRAAQTAGFLSRSTGIGVIYDDDLMEFQNGLIAGMPREEAASRYPRLEVRYPHTVVYEMESDIHFRMRAETAMSKILHENPADLTIAVVAHGGSINMLFRSFLGLPVCSDVHIDSGDTGIHEWRAEGARRKVIAVNQLWHLEGVF